MAKGDKDKAGAENTASTGGTGTIQISVDSLRDLATQISELDTQIASASGSDAAAKKAIVEQVTTENAEQVDGMLNDLITSISEQDTRILVGLVTRLEERLKTELAPKVDEFVTAELQRTQSVGKEQVDGLKQKRKELLDRFKALRQVLESFSMDVSSVPEPKRGGGGRPAGSGGGKGASGSNKENYRYLIDGKPSPKSQNKFSSVAFYATHGVPKALDSNANTDRWSTDQLRDFLKEQGVDFPNVDEWEVTLPNGKKVGARRMTEQDRIELGLNTETSTDGDGAAAPAAETTPAEPATV